MAREAQIAPAREGDQRMNRRSDWREPGPRHHALRNRLVDRRFRTERVRV